MNIHITLIFISLVIAVCVIISLVLDYRLHQQDNYKEIYKALDKMDKSLDQRCSVMKDYTQLNKDLVRKVERLLGDD